jgi:hypothetical protein
MKILDIISEDKALNEGGLWTKWFARPIEEYLEKRAAAKLIAEIEKKYAKDIAKQTACKDLSEKYGKYLAERELAGQSPIPLERLILKQKEYAGTSFAKDAEFIELTTRLAQIKKTQYLKDGAQAGKAADDGVEAGKNTGVRVGKEAIDATDELVKKKKQMFEFVNDRGTVINAAYYTVIAAEYVNIWARYQKDVNTTTDALKKGKIPDADVKGWPVANNGETVTTDLKQGIGIRDNPLTNPTKPYVYDNEASRLTNWKDWRDSQSLGIMIQQLSLASTAFWVGEKTFGKFGAGKVVTGIIGFVAKLAPQSKFNRLGQLVDAAAISAFVYNMSTDDASTALKSLYLHGILGPFWDQIVTSVGRSLVPYETLIKFFSEIASSILNIVGTNVIGTNPPTPVTPIEPPAPPQPAASSPASQDVSKTDSNGSVVNPKDKKDPDPEPPKVTSQDVFNDTRAGRGRAVTNAKATGAPTVTIGGKTYKTSDFSEVDGEWVTNDGYALPK